MKMSPYSRMGSIMVSVQEVSDWGVCVLVGKCPGGMCPGGKYGGGGYMSLG